MNHRVLIVNLFSFFSHINKKAALKFKVHKNLEPPIGNLTDFSRDWMQMTQRHKQW